VSKFKSEYFKSSEDLVRARNRARSNVRDRRNRLAIVRKFSNGLATMSEKEAEELGRTEITNHLTTYRSLQQQEGLFFSMVSTTNALCEITVDTDNPEQDAVVGQRMSEIINRGAIHFKGKFANFWRKVAGEWVIAGGGPIVFPQTSGWLPELKPSMLFPPETDLDSDKVTFAFDPVELSVDDLKNLGESVKGDANYIEKKNIDRLLKAIAEQIEEDRSLSIGSSEGDVDNSSVRDQTGGKSPRITSIPACWYYEVKYEDNGESYVSATLFCENLQNLIKDAKDRDILNSMVLAYVDKAYESATDWLQLAVIDSEIGGVKTLDTVRGTAELVYPSAVDIEELLNLMLEGDKIRAKPKFAVATDMNADILAKWNAAADSFVPAGVTEMEFRGSTNALQTPFAILSQNAAGLSAASVSNNGRGGELRQQAVERQRNNGILQNNQVSDAYNHLDSLLENVVHRLLTMKVTPGCEGYNEAKFIRKQLEEYGVNYKELAKREYGRFRYLKIRAVRTIGNGDRGQQIESADWLMSNIMAYPPESRPLIVHRATLLQTQDPDWTDRLVKVPQIIINSQKVTAENEFDTIARRAILGQTLPIGVDDIDQDHIPIHLMDLQALVASNQIRPWDQMSVLQFGGAVEHTGLHIQRLLGNPATNPEAKPFLQAFQQIVTEAQAIVTDLQEREEQQGGGLTPKEQADLEVQWAKVDLAARSLGIKIETENRLEQNRQRRAQSSERGQYAREINDDRRLQLDAVRVAEEQKRAANEQSSQTTAD